MIRTFRYVTYNRLADYLALGWMIVADLGPYHNQWALLCEWLCQCRVVEPRK